MGRVRSSKKWQVTQLDQTLAEITKFVDGQGWDPNHVFCNKRTNHLIVGSGKHILYFGPPTAIDDVTALEEPEPGLFSVAELLDLDFGERVPVVEGLIFEGETVVIGGRPKVGKSRFIHQLALSLVRQKPFLGMGVPKRHRVLISDLENGKYALQDRFTARSSCLPQTFPHALHTRFLDRVCGRELFRNMEGNFAFPHVVK